MTGGCKVQLGYGEGQGSRQHQCNHQSQDSVQHLAVILCGIHCPGDKYTLLPQGLYALLLLDQEVSPEFMVCPVLCIFTGNVHPPCPCFYQVVLCSLHQPIQEEGVVLILLS